MTIKHGASKAAALTSPSTSPEPLVCSTRQPSVPLDPDLLCLIRLPAPTRNKTLSVTAVTGRAGFDFLLPRSTPCSQRAYGDETTQRASGR